MTVVSSDTFDEASAASAASAFDARAAYPWVPDRGDGTFCNPVLYADYSDPDVIRDGDDFFLVASSFNCTPGLPILHSRVLVNWTIVNHAVRNLPDPRGVYDRVQPGCGVWAPAIRKHAGRFWIFFPMPDEGIYVTTADHPAGAWSEPHLVQAGRGLIDPCPLWDDDGRAYLVHAYAESRSGIKHVLRVRPMAPDGSRLLGEGKIIFHDPERQPTLEGPKFLKRGGYYYILAPAGGVETGWQLVLRSRNVYGPYEERVVLEQGSTPVNGPHQGALEQTAAGEWWFLHFQDAKPYGRVVHLQPVAWRDGWPVMGVDHDGNGIGEPVAAYRKPAIGRTVAIAVPQTSDEFEGPRLGLQWQWHANHRAEWHSLAARPGWLRLYAQVVEQIEQSEGDRRIGLGAAGNLLLQKFPARSFVAHTRVDIVGGSEGERAGLVVMGREHAALAVRCGGGTRREIVAIVNGHEEVVAIAKGGAVDLRVEVADGGECTFGYAADGRAWRQAGIRFRAREGVWIGAKVGVFSVTTSEGSGEVVSGHADFEYFRFGPAVGEGGLVGESK
jgi:beta-xylosidase